MELGQPKERREAAHRLGVRVMRPEGTTSAGILGRETEDAGTRMAQWEASATMDLAVRLLQSVRDKDQ